MKLNNNIALLYIILLHTPDSILTNQSAKRPIYRKIEYFLTKKLPDIAIGQFCLRWQLSNIIPLPCACGA